MTERRAPRAGSERRRERVASSGVLEERRDARLPRLGERGDCRNRAGGEKKRARGSRGAGAPSRSWRSRRPGRRESARRLGGPRDRRGDQRARRRRRRLGETASTDWRGLRAIPRLVYLPRAPRAASQKRERLRDRRRRGGVCAADAPRPGGFLRGARQTVRGERALFGFVFVPKETRAQVSRRGRRETRELPEPRSAEFRVFSLGGCSLVAVARAADRRVSDETERGDQRFDETRFFACPRDARRDRGRAPGGVHERREALGWIREPMRDGARETRVEKNVRGTFRRLFTRTPQKRARRADDGRARLGVARREQPGRRLEPGGRSRR